MSRWRLGGWWPVALAGMLVAAVAVGQRARGGLLSWNGQPITPSSVTTDSLTAGTVKANVIDGGTGVFTGPLTVSGQTGLQGLTAGLTRVLQLDAGNITVVNPGKICTDVPCTTNNLGNDGAGSITVAGPLSGNSNWSTAGSGDFGTFVIPRAAIKNTGTAAECTGTGSVCINDGHGLEGADAGVTAWTLTARGLLILPSSNSTATPGAITIDKPSGRSAVKTGESFVTVTDALVVATSNIQVTPLDSSVTDCAGWYVSNVGAGSFTVTCPVGIVIADWKFAWLVHGAF